MKNRILKLTKTQKALIMNYLSNCYDCSDYDRASTKENVFDIFYNEVGQQSESQGYSRKQAFIEWLQGLPTACRVDFETFEQERLLNEWKISVKIDENSYEVFYTALATVFLEQFSYAEICNLINGNKR